MLDKTLKLQYKYNFNLIFRDINSNNILINFKYEQNKNYQLYDYSII